MLAYEFYEKINKDGSFNRPDINKFIPINKISKKERKMIESKKDNYRPDNLPDEMNINDLPRGVSIVYRGHYTLFRVVFKGD